MSDARRPSSSSSSTSSDDSARPTKKSKEPQMCLKCKKLPMEYETNGCHHPLFCKGCAMKCASGGVCKVCGQMYGNLQRIS